MRPLPYSLYRASDTRELDRIAIEDYAIPGIELMNRAGAVILAEIRQQWPQAQRLLVVCGGGNNGGDGYVVARLAREQGLGVQLCSMVETDSLQGEAALACAAYRASGGEVLTFDPELLQDADIVVDALLGTGLDRPVRGAWQTVIQSINQSARPVIAVDIPSGLNADTGCVMGEAIQAQVTVSFIGLNQGLLTADAVDLCGEIRFDALGVPDAVYEACPAPLERIDWQAVCDEWPSRARSSHKGCYGHSLLIGGNRGMAGAIRLAAEAAARTGSGLTTALTLAEHAVVMAAARPEIMWQGEAERLECLLARANVVGIGPGLGRDAWARDLLEKVLASPLPVVVDADALNLIAEEGRVREQWIMTPHPGEAARLLQCAVSDIHEDRFQAARVLAQRYQAVVVLKGAGSLVSDPEGHLALCSGGNPGMASGGMGDVLTGIITALVAQGLPLYQAARLAVALHAGTADCLAEKGLRGYLAGDVVAALRSSLNAA